MKLFYLFGLAALVTACAHEPEMPTMGMAATGDTVVVDNPGQITVAGVTPAAALGAIDTAQVTAQPAVKNGVATTSEQPGTVATGAISVEGAQPAAVLGAIDPTKLIDNPPKKPN